MLRLLLLVGVLDVALGIMSPTESTKQFYNEHVDSYIANIDKAGVTHVPTAHLNSFVQYLQSSFSGQLKVLELGCGHGRDAEMLAANNIHVMATDYSRSMLLKAQERLEASSFPAAVHLLELDMRTVGQHFLPHSLHGVWACATVVHLPKKDLPALLSSLYTLLKPGGTIYMSVKVKPSSDSNDETFDPDTRYGGIKKFYAFYEESELLDYFQEAGFVIVEHGTLDHRDKDAYATHPFLHVFARKPLV
jgi:cyclopropane fatty-acyl-phospholipid synthase-like methyltransferase